MLRLQFIESYSAPFAPSGADGDAFVVLSGSILEQRNGRKVEPIFRVTIQNPGIVGWMPAALRYAILWEQRTEDVAPVLLARGRLVPLPTGMAGATIELTFRCLPPSSDDVVKSAANLLRISEAFDYDPDAELVDRLDAEYYDPLFFGAAADDDYEGVLVARPEIWRWDRQTLEVSRTHIVDSDVIHDIGFNGVGDPPALSVTNPPKPISRIRLSAAWTQTAKGRQTVSENSSVTTFTWEDFQNTFPQPGTSIGSNTGWTVGESEIVDVSDSTPVSLTISGSKFGSASGGTVKLLPKYIEFRIAAAFDYQQQREEMLEILMPSGLQELPEEDDQTETMEQPTLQALNVDPSTPEWQYEDPDTLERMHYDVGYEVLANGSAWSCVTEHDATEDFTVREIDDGPVLWERREKRAPMKDSKSARYFDLPRGVRSVRHAVLRLYRSVLERSQCAETTFEVPWMVGRSITTADSCRIAHRRLPGGEVTGKVTSVELVMEQGGRRSAKISIVSVPGTGTIVPAPGEGQFQTGDVVYSTSYRGVTEPVNAAALAAQSPRIFEFENIWSEQASAANGSSDPVAVIGANPTRLRIAFNPLREEDTLRRRMTVTCLPPSLPKQLNLRPDIGA
ncbi:hypothetical protein [Rhizobium sp. BK456]|nr:hypothetical protein [Rhizobium sp. BK456]MBB3521006.1 hypothetical protein [Rhizobium sp. BK456]